MSWLFSSFALFLSTYLKFDLSYEELYLAKGADLPTRIQWAWCIQANQQTHPKASGTAKKSYHMCQNQN